MSKANISRKISLLQFDQPWVLKGCDGQGPLGRRITFDEQLLHQVIAGESGPCLCITRDSRCLVSTVRESRMPNFAVACQALDDEGWPVFVRCTGGSCVPQGPGVINLSVIHPKLRGWRLEDGYELLCDVLNHFLASYGLDATTGEVPGSFCDGRYNLQVGGLKLVGTAQRWAGGHRKDAAVLAHACLLVDLDLVEATEKVNSLYRLCGNPRRFSPDACTTLRDCLDGNNNQPTEEFVVEVEQRLATMVSDCFDILR